MMMEDLSSPAPGGRSCSQLDQIAGLARDEAEAATAFAARLHAHYLGRIPLSGFRDVRTQYEPDPARRQYNAETYPKMWKLWLQLQADGRVWDVGVLGQYDLSETGPFNRCVNLYAHNVLAFYEYFGGDMMQHFTLNHGDLRADNIMASRNSAGELASFVPIDTQTLKACPGEFDLAYMLSQSLTTADRQAWQVALIRKYHARMPGDYSIAASLYHFQLFLVYGAARIALITAAESNMLGSERGALLFRTMMARAMIACDEWGCLAAWKNMLTRVGSGMAGPPPDAEAMAMVPPHLLAAITASAPPADAVLVLSDIDGTMIGNDEAIPKFNELWSRQAAGSVLCYNTSRPLESFIRLKTTQNSPILVPRLLVCNGGTSIYSFPSGIVDSGEEVLNTEYAEFLGDGYDRDAVKAIGSSVAHTILGERPGPAPEPDASGSTRGVLSILPRFVLEQRSDASTKLRYTIMLRTAETRADAARLLSALQSAFEEAEVAVHLDQSWVQIPSPGEQHENRASGTRAADMCLTDMLPSNAGKGAATTWVRQHLGFTEEQTMVAGDGANDLPMFFGAGKERGTIVGNAEERLMQAHKADPRPEHYLAHGFAADAIAEGLCHFCLTPAAPAAAARL
jgi:hydroxymethylpyrimidine pyrophosphatase-like HAD family hydrolase